MKCHGLKKKKKKVFLSRWKYSITFNFCTLMKSSILRLGFYHLSVCLTLRRMAVTHLKIHWKLCNEFKVRVCYHCHAAAAKSLQSCLTLCDPIDGSPPGSAVPGILQARTLEWVAISFSNAWKWKVKVKSLSRVWPSVTPWTAAHQAPPSMGFSRQEYWSGVPLPSP